MSSQHKAFYAYVCDDTGANKPIVLPIVWKLIKQLYAAHIFDNDYKSFILFI